MPRPPLPPKEAKASPRFPACNPANGKAWALQDPAGLYAHCESAAEFADPFEFLVLADVRLRFYQLHRDDGPWADPKQLEQFARHAAGLADAIEAIDSRHMLFNALQAVQDRARLALPKPRELHRIAEAALELRKRSEAKSGKGKRHGVERAHRYVLIRDCWQHYPEALRSLELRSHFLESLRQILGRGKSTPDRRALQAEARRALGIK